MPLTISEIGIVPSVERFVSTNDLLHHIRALGLLIVLTLCVSISAYILALHYGRPTQFSSFEPRVGFQADSGGRDSMDIISACASTLITCVYSSVHFDVPRSFAHRLSLRQKLVARDYWLELWVKVTFWLLGVFSPEMLVLHAFFEYMIARRDVAWMREHGHADWTVALAFAADMGALIPDGAKEGERPPHSGFALHEALLRHHEPGALDCRALEHELADHTKADTLFKLLTTLQIARFFAGTVARWAVHLPIAPLETITCAYVACTLVYYGFWLQKPYNVNERIIVRVRLTLPRTRRLAPSQVLTGQDPQPAATVGERMWQSSPYMTQGSLVAAAASVVVGLAHLACWDVEFPNSNGQVLWRYCSVLLFALPVAVFVIILGAAIIDRQRVTEVMNVMALSMIVVYCMARVVLLILLGHSFQSLPKGVYDTHSVPWLSFIPFIH